MCNYHNNTFNFNYFGGTVKLANSASLFNSASSTGIENDKICFHKKTERNWQWLWKKTFYHSQGQLVVVGIWDGGIWGLAELNNLIVP